MTKDNAAPELFICRRLVGGSDEGTKYFYYEEVEPYTRQPAEARGVPVKICGVTAMMIALSMKGQWSKRPDEKDTEHVKRVWEIFAANINVTLPATPPALQARDEKIREALERLASDARFGIAADDYEHARPDEYHQQQQRLQADYKTILTLLERLEGVDRVALREDIEAVHLWINDLTTDFPYDCVESINEAARLVLSLGKPQKIDPLSGTPDGLVEG